MATLDLDAATSRQLENWGWGVRAEAELDDLERSGLAP